VPLAAVSGLGVATCLVLMFTSDRFCRPWVAWTACGFILIGWAALFVDWLKERNPLIVG
jgi:hypothetical protein